MTTLDPKLLEIIDKKIEKTVSKSIDKVQISLLKEHFLTRDEFLEAIEKIDKRFEAVQKQMDDRFNALQNQIDKRFKKVYKRFDDMDFDQGKIVEGISYSLVKREFEKRGFDLKLKARQHFIDVNNEVHPDTKDVEIDIFHYNPNIICEVTFKLNELDKVRTFIKKILFLEKMYKEPFQRFFLCLKVKDSVRGELKRILKQYNVEPLILEED